MTRTHSIRRVLRARGLEHLASRALFWWHHLDNAGAPGGNVWAWRHGGAQQWAATRDGDAAGKTIVDPRTRRIEVVPAGQLGFGAPQEPSRSQLQQRNLLTGGTTVPTGWSLTDVSGTSSAGVPSMLGDRDGAQGWRTQAAGGQMYLDGASITFAPNTQYALSVWLEALNHTSGDEVLATLSSTSFIASGTPQILASDSDVTDLPARMVRVFTTDGSGGSASLRLGVGLGGATTAAVTFSRPQIESGEYASSPIPNDTDATKTRDADALRWVDATLFGRVAPAGTLLWVGRTPYGAADIQSLERLCALNEGATTNNRAMLYVNSSQSRLTAQIKNAAGASILQANADILGSFARRQTLAVVQTWDASGAAYVVNGRVEGSASAMTPPSALDLLELGSSDAINGRSGAEHFLAAVFEGSITELEAQNITNNAELWKWPA